MPFAAIATPLTLLALALPFLFGVTRSPVSNFWPLLVSWVCGAACVLLVALRAWRMAPARRAARLEVAQLLALGLALAAVVASVIGLVQYLVGDPGLAPFVHPSTPGQAVGNLRQRNQQASLLSLGLWALCWWTLHSGGGRWRRSLSWSLPVGAGGVLVAFSGVWIAISQAATASRTGALQCLLVLALLVCWRKTGRGQALRLALVALAVFLLAAWLLPQVLWQLQGVRADALLARFGGDPQSCTSRRVLWSNMLTLIAQRPWLGWGPGELDYAHYVTLFPGERFCVLLDNAHNLPLHLAVELGLPAALALCGGALAWVLYRRPWRETRPERQLAWGVLAIIGLHSLLEYPLWYGPFQIAALSALALLLWPRRRFLRPAAGAAAAGLLAALVWALAAGAAWDYHRVSQLYKPYAQRAAAYRDDTQRKVDRSLLFGRQVDFARLTTTAPTRDNARAVNTLAHELLHYSPEPRVIQALVESAVMLGRDDEAAFHMKRFRLAYPNEYARWMGARGAAKSSAPAG